MASAGRQSELPEFNGKNQKPTQTNDPWYIPVVPTGKSEFGVPNCPVRALRYYHRYMSEHPDLRNLGQMLFIHSSHYQG